MLKLDELAYGLAQHFNVIVGDPPRLEASQFPQWQLIATELSQVLQQLGLRVIGISGAQGTGKSTLAELLSVTLSEFGVKAVNVSLDDFYLTKQERQRLAVRVHPLLSTRGVPGTHDTTWLARTLDAFQFSRSEAATVSVPRFDKGLDDRAGKQTQSGDVLILEGWCVGATAQDEQKLKQPINALEAKEDPDGRYRRWVNSQLRQRYEPLWQQVDFWVQLRVPGMDEVRSWRAQQEMALPHARRMGEEVLRRFIDHYERLTRAQLESPARVPGLVVYLDAQHAVAGVDVLGTRKPE
jgi:D-glycerate 3-kinase